MKIKHHVQQNDTHSYLLDNFTVAPNEGITLTEKVTELKLVRGSKIESENLIPPQDGVLTEQLLLTAFQFLTSVNTGDLWNKETQHAIAKIQEAMFWLRHRQEDREDRGVKNTYKK